MPQTWHLLSMLGDSRLLLPTAAVLMFAGWRAHSSWHWRWASALTVVGLLVLGSKLAFLGWGIGVARWDFTGFSGHAAMAAGVWPMVCYIAMPGDRSRRLMALLGLSLAGAVAYSRLPLNAHSWSEVISGWLLGAVASSLVLRGAQPVLGLRCRWLVLALGMGICMPLAFPQIRTHQMVVALAKTLSGTAKEFDRSIWSGGEPRRGS